MALRPFSPDSPARLSCLAGGCTVEAVAGAVRGADGHGRGGCGLHPMDVGPVTLWCGCGRCRWVNNDLWHVARASSSTGWCSGRLRGARLWPHLEQNLRVRPIHVLVDPPVDSLCQARTATRRTLRARVKPPMAMTRVSGHPRVSMELVDQPHFNPFFDGCGSTRRTECPSRRSTSAWRCRRSTTTSSRRARCVFTLPHMRHAHPPCTDRAYTDHNAPFLLPQAVAAAAAVTAAVTAAIAAVAAAISAALAAAKPPSGLSALLPPTSAAPSFSTIFLRSARYAPAPYAYAHLPFFTVLTRP